MKFQNKYHTPLYLTNIVHVWDFHAQKIWSLWGTCIKLIDLHSRNVEKTSNNMDTYIEYIIYCGGNIKMNFMSIVNIFVISLNWKFTLTQLTVQISFVFLISKALILIECIFISNDFR